GSSESPPQLQHCLSFRAPTHFSADQVPAPVRSLSLRARVFPRSSPLRPAVNAAFMQSAIVRAARLRKCDPRTPTQSVAADWEADAQQGIDTANQESWK